MVYQISPKIAPSFIADTENILVSFFPDTMYVCNLVLKLPCDGAGADIVLLLVCISRE